MRGIFRQNADCKKHPTGAPTNGRPPGPRRRTLVPRLRQVQPPARLDLQRGHSTGVTPGEPNPGVRRHTPEQPRTGRPSAQLPETPSSAPARCAENTKKTTPMPSQQHKSTTNALEFQPPNPYQGIRGTFKRGWCRSLARGPAPPARSQVKLRHCPRLSWSRQKGIGVRRHGLRRAHSC